MILADTSIWVDHLRSNKEQLSSLLSDGQILCHPLVIAELALGSLKNRAQILTLLDDLPSAPVAEIREVRTLIEQRALYARGIGFVDASLVASCLLAPGTLLWTTDRRLSEISQSFAILR